MTFINKIGLWAAAPLGAAAFFVALGSLSNQAAADSANDRRSALTQLVRNDCGSCHGITLKGGLGPALTPDRLSQMPSDLIAFWIKNGRPERGMPAWEPLLSDSDIAYIANGLKNGAFLNVQATGR